MTYKKGLIVGARTFPSNLFDGHTLAKQLEQAKILTGEHNTPIKQVHVDLGYRGGDHTNPGVEIIHRARYKSMLKADRKRLKRRQVITNRRSGTYKWIMECEERGSNGQLVMHCTWCCVPEALT